MLNNNTKPNFSLHSNNKVLSLENPVIMGVLNVTPDSFYDGGKHTTTQEMMAQIGSMIEQGAKIIDIGAATSKPGSQLIDFNTERARLEPVLAQIKYLGTDVFFSLDTYNAETAKWGCDWGIDIINDISAGQIDRQMLATVANLQKPYIAMHMQGLPENMQLAPSYTHVTKIIMAFFEERLNAFKMAGIKAIILDVGFGFGKTIEQNYQLLRELSFFESIGYPILAGLSRKSMIYKVLNTAPESALNGTSALNMLALQNGVKILRVHDVKAAVECVKLYTAYLG
jgi:dihydropteroate synthase